MTAVVSSAEMDGTSVLSELTMSQKTEASMTWNISQNTTATMETVDQQDSMDRTPLLTVTPQTKQLRGESAESGKTYEIPRCEIPPPSEIEPIEKFVVNAVRSKEAEATTIGSDSGSSEPPDPSHVEGYQAIINSFKRPSDPRMLRKLMIALRTAGNGSVLNQLVSRNIHGQLVHLIIRFNPTRPPQNYEDVFIGDHEELLKVYEDFSICDAHFHLLLAMVSAKSTHVLPIISAMWKFLTRFGPIEDQRL